MANILLWILVILLLNILNYVGWWGLNYHDFILFDILTAFVSGSFIAGLKRLLNRAYPKQIKAFFLTSILSLLTMPFILHYDIALALLSKTMGSHPTYSGIFWEGLFSTTKKMIIIGAFLYISTLIFFFLRKERVAEEVESAAKKIRKRNG